MLFSDTVLDALKVSDSEEVSDQDTDRNVVECEEGFACFISKL